MARGHVRVRGKGWVYVIRHESLDKPEWSRQQPTKADAERLMTARLADLDRGIGVHQAKDTVAVYLRAWLDGRQKIRQSTRVNYRFAIEQHLIPQLGAIEMGKLKPSQIAAWHGWMRGQGVSDLAIHYAHRVLTTALNQAVRWGQLPNNPAALVEKPRLQQREYQWWEPAEVQQFLDATAESDDGVIWRLTVTALLRRGELLALRWSDIDMTRKRIAVRRTLSKSGVKGAPWNEEEPKGGRQRVVSVPAGTIEALRRHRERQAFRRSRSDRWVDEDRVFCNRDGRVLDPETLRLRFKDAVTEAGLPSIRFHDLRHTGATLLLRGGVPLKTVSEMLGHYSITLTASTYIHISESMQDEAADVMSKMIGGS